MNNVRVLLIAQDGTEYDVSYIQEIPLSLNLLIADVRKPDKREASFSKTITFPGTGEVNQFFQIIWQINVDLTKFNPNIKCGIYYYVNEIEQLRGDLQLVQINVDDEHRRADSYECTAKGRLGNLFMDIGDAYLTDLDFSEYDHTLNKTNVTNSWATSIVLNGGSQSFSLGSGYVYPLIDYGFNGLNYSELHVKHLRPAIYKKIILDKIFEAAGKTYTSTYFNSLEFRRQIVPATEENIKLSASDLNNSQFYARRNANQSGNNTTLNYTSAWVSPTNGTSTVVLFNEDNVAPYHDAGGQYNTATGVFTVGNNNQYNITAVIDFDFTVSNDTGTATNMQINTGQVVCVLKKFNGSTWQTFGGAVGSVLINATYPTLTATGQVSFPTWSGSAAAGEQFRVEVYPFQINVDLYTSGAVLVTTGNTTCSITTKTNSTFYASLVNQNITEGYTLEMNQAIPTNIKQLDWLMSEFKTALLYMDVDKDNDNNYIIEPRESFYTGEVEDWTEKQDIGKGSTVIPMGELDAKKYEYTYKTDTDEYNQDYERKFKEVYGYGFTEAENEFIKGINKTELIYSATPVVGNAVNGLVIPKIYKNDNGSIKNFRANIRSLYYGGVIALNNGSWTLKSSSGDTTYTTYPYAGHNNNPYNPTFDLLFDQPRQVYYNFPIATYTNNNLFNKYHSRFINQITDKNSLILKAWFNLSAVDIHKFDFRKTVFLKDTYYYVNAIRDYNVLDKQSTLVELLKLQDFNAFEPEIITIEEPWTDQGTALIINGNLNTGTPEDNNNNFGTGSTIFGGNDNWISSGARNINLTNCEGVTVMPDVENFTGVGLSNREIDSSFSNTTLTEGGATLERTITTNTNGLSSDQLVYVDMTGGDITYTFNSRLQFNKPVTFKRIDASGNTFRVAGSLTTENLDGSGTPAIQLPASMDSVKIIHNGTDLYIIE